MCATRGYKLLCFSFPIGNFACIVITILCVNGKLINHWNIDSSCVRKLNCYYRMNNKYCANGWWDCPCVKKTCSLPLSQIAFHGFPIYSYYMHFVSHISFPWWSTPIFMSKLDTINLTHKVCYKNELFCYTQTQSTPKRMHLLTYHYN